MDSTKLLFPLYVLLLAFFSREVVAGDPESTSGEGESLTSGISGTVGLSSEPASSGLGLTSGVSGSAEITSAAPKDHSPAQSPLTSSQDPTSTDSQAHTAQISSLQPDASAGASGLGLASAVPGSVQISSLQPDASAGASGLGLASAVPGSAQISSLQPDASVSSGGSVVDGLPAAQITSGPAPAHGPAPASGAGVVPQSSNASKPAGPSLEQKPITVHVFPLVKDLIMDTFAASSGHHIKVIKHKDEVVWQPSDPKLYATGVVSVALGANAEPERIVITMPDGRPVRLDRLGSGRWQEVRTCVELDVARADSDSRIDYTKEGEVVTFRAVGDFTFDVVKDKAEETRVAQTDDEDSDGEKDGVSDSLRVKTILNILALQCVTLLVIFA